MTSINPRMVDNAVPKGPPPAPKPTIGHTFTPQRHSGETVIGDVQKTVGLPERINQVWNKYAPGQDASFTIIAIAFIAVGFGMFVWRVLS